MSEKFICSFSLRTDTFSSIENEEQSGGTALHINKCRGLIYKNNAEQFIPLTSAKKQLR